MGVLIGSAVVPIACCLSWSKCTATAAISGAWGGLAASLTCWLVYTKCVYGEITLATTGDVSTPSHAHPFSPAYISWYLTPLCGCSCPCQKLTRAHWPGSMLQLQAQGC